MKVASDPLTQRTTGIAVFALPYPCSPPATVTLHRLYSTVLVWVVVDQIGVT
jgi:hypothetical protein